MLVLALILSLYSFLLLLSSENGVTNWLQEKTAQAMDGWENGMRRMAREEGQGLVEYALLIVFIALIIIIILTVLGRRIYLIFCFIICIFRNGYGNCTLISCTVLN
jgi:pilus assembly protein Flp/PilA